MDAVGRARDSIGRRALFEPARTLSSLVCADISGKRRGLWEEGVKSHAVVVNNVNVRRLLTSRVGFWREG
jgi:hypothetical protein